MGNYSVNVTVHAVEKLREIGVGSNLSDGQIRSMAMQAVLEELEKGMDPSHYPMLDGGEDNNLACIAVLEPSPLNSLGQKARLVVCYDTVGDSVFAVVTALDESSYLARKQLKEKREEHDEKKHRAMEEMSLRQDGEKWRALLKDVVSKEPSHLVFSPKGIHYCKSSGQTLDRVHEMLDIVKDVRVFQIKPLHIQIGFDEED